MHDIGNCVNRVDHAHSGAILAYEILKDMGMDVEKKNRNHDGNSETTMNKQEQQ